MNQEEIKFTQRRIGVEADGFWGPISTQGAKDHLRRLMPSPNPWPTQSQVRGNGSIYGRSGVKNGYTPPLKSIDLPFDVYLYGNQDNVLTEISAHEKCADSLQRVYGLLEEAFPTQESRIEHGITAFYGVYNPRNSRNSSVRSMHAYACAHDNDANRNRNLSHWPMRSKMSIKIMECFAKEGWLSAGAFWGRDAMHHQATAV